MLTETDFQALCDDILGMEERMETAYRTLADKLTHPAYKRLFETLAREEQEHANRVHRLRELLAGESMPG